METMLKSLGERLSLSEKIIKVCYQRIQPVNVETVKGTEYVILSDSLFLM